MPTYTATSQGYSPAFCFGMLLLPRISCHTRRTTACSHKATRTLPARPPHLTPQCPISHQPQCSARVLGDGQTALLAVSLVQDKAGFPQLFGGPRQKPAVQHKVRAAASAAHVLIPRN